MVEDLEYYCEYCGSILHHVPDFDETGTFIYCTCEEWAHHNFGEIIYTRREE